MWNPSLGSLLFWFVVALVICGLIGSFDGTNRWRRKHPYWDRKP